MFLCVYVFLAAAPQPHPFPFHVLNVATHALASIMVLALANHFFAKAEGLGLSAASAVNPVEEQQKTGRRKAGRVLPLQEGFGRGLWLVGSAKAQCQALMCALMFAVHPIHVEVREDRR
jgi:hypothetical protein